MQDGLPQGSESAATERRDGAGADVQAWPFVAGRRLVFLLDASSRLEERILERWIETNRPEGVNPAACERICIPASRRPRLRRRAIDGRLEASLAAGDDPMLAPLRVAWSPPEKDAAREPRLADLLTLGDPRDPGRLRQAWLLRRRPERHCVVVADPAPASALQERWRRVVGADSTQSLVEFVLRQAQLALERAERRLRGARYKVPRFVHEEILARPSFRGGTSRLAHELGRPEPAVARRAARTLREIAATHSPYVIDLAANLIRLLYRRGYGEALHYDRGELRDIYALAQRYPVVFLPTHKSNLDHLVLQYALHENGHPPNHTAGGINMNFFPVGPLIRRSGLFFIRRTFKDDPVYKFVLQQYLDYLVEKRFPLEWYIEGGRSRSGKLLPPRLGLLAYVIDALRRGKSEDVYLIPTAIAYDQIQDVGDYVAESRGARKERESFSWFLRVVRGIRGRLGDIHIRFGEPLSLAASLAFSGPPSEAEPDERTLAVAKIAFDVAVRINRVTPITPTSLVALALLGADRALTVEETVTVLRNWVEYVRRRRLPTSEQLALDTNEGVRTALEALVSSGVLSCFAEGPEPIYAIGADQDLAAAYYRNTIVHFFVTSAIAELALLRAAEEGVENRRAEFWSEALRLRDLLKFEFFFADKEEFREEIAREVSLHVADWQEALAGGATQIQALVRRLRPFTAHRVLRPFLEAYRVVSDELEQLDATAPFDEVALLARCLARGKQYRLQRRIQSAESVSKVLFATALELARNRALAEPGADRLVDRRRVFAVEVRNVLRRVDAIAALAASRRAGLIA
jgi:glycerol-3-phosphate O-acyltransferase